MTDPRDKPLEAAVPRAESRLEYRRRVGEQKAQASQPAALGQPPAVGQLNWIPLGPSAVLQGPSTTEPIISGPLAGVLVADDGRRVYAASVNGGVFRSDDAGETFYPLMSAFDLEPRASPADSLAIGAFAGHPARPDRLYVGSGEADTPEVVLGVGPLVSDDGGVNWITERYNPPRPAETTLFYGMAVDPTDPELAVGATNDGLFRRQPRNQDVAGLPEPRPQSYFIQLDTNTGTPSTLYWDADGLSTATAWTGVAPWTAQATVFTPFVLDGRQYFLRYVPGLGGANNAWVYTLSTAGAPSDPPLQAQTWTQNLKLMGFGLGGGQYLLRYDPAPDTATLLRWKADGTSDNMWAIAKAWGANWTAFVPFVLFGGAYFLKYNSANGALTELWRWGADLEAQQVGAPRPLPSGAQLVPFELGGEALLMAYEPNNGGQTTLYRWGMDGTLTQLWQDAALLPAGGILAPFTWEGRQGDAPRFLLYVAGPTALYGWGPNRMPVPIWTRGWAANLTFMPFLMGYDWADRQASITPRPLSYDPTTRRLVENRKTSSVVAASDGGTTVFYAAFWTAPILDPAVRAPFRDKGQVYASLDRGKTWSQLGVFPPDQGRITLAVSPTDINLVYAVTEGGALYRYQRASGPELSQWNAVTGAPLRELWFDPSGGAMPAIAVSRSDAGTVYFGGDAAVLASAGAAVDRSGALYRCVITPGPGARFQMAYTYIGTSLPVGIRGFGFSPVENDLWVATARGLFRSAQPGATAPLALEGLFRPRNTGLSTTMVNGVGPNPTTDAVLFTGNEDGGFELYAGNEAWGNVSRLENSGRVLVRSTGQQVLGAGTLNNLYRSTDQGLRGTFQKVAGPGTDQIPLQGGDQVKLYAPLVKARTEPRVVFGTRKPWFSDDFGATWRSLPNNNGTDNLGSTIRAIGLSDNGKRLYVALDSKEIWKFTDTGRVGNASWSVRRAIQAEGVHPLSEFMGANPELAISDIVVDPADADGYSIFVTLSGDTANADGWKRVWHFSNPGGAQGGTWTQRGGPLAGPASQQLMNVAVYTLAAVRVLAATQLYAGADIGVWRSADGGAHWAPFGEGLPEAVITSVTYVPPNDDLARPPLLRAGTYGRGVYERILLAAMPPNPRDFEKPVQLYLRANVLDRGIYDVQDNVPNPVGPGVVRVYDGIDIKLSNSLNTVLPPPTGTAYTFPRPASLTFTDFATLTDASAQLRRNASARVYVQVHNRGILPTSGAYVVVLLSIRLGNAPPPLPAVPQLPVGSAGDVRTGTPIADGNWATVAIVAAAELAAGSPQVISADIPANLLAAAGTYCLVALANAPQDLFQNGNINVVPLVTAESKAAMKYLIVV